MNSAGTEQAIHLLTDWMTGRRTDRLTHSRNHTSPLSTVNWLATITWGDEAETYNIRRATALVQDD